MHLQMQILLKRKSNKCISCQRKLFLFLSEEVFWSQQMQRRRRSSLSIESVVHETGRRCHWKTGQRGTGRDIFRHTALGQMSQYLKRVWGCPTSILSFTLFTINFHSQMLEFQTGKELLEKYGIAFSDQYLRSNLWSIFERSTHCLEKFQCETLPKFGKGPTLIADSLQVSPSLS